MAKKKKNKKPEYIHSVGRRKTAAARIRFYPNKKGGITIDEVSSDEYFPGEVKKEKLLAPLKVCEQVGKHKITVKVEGSGVKGQLGAVIHGIARALDKFNTEKFHIPLKQNEFLTRDPRMKERRKPGTGGKARAKKQSPKR